jgi:hypothetical protein
MSLFIAWIDDKKKSTYVLTALLVGCYAAFFVFPGVLWVTDIALIGSIIFPLVIFLVWIVDSAVVEKLLSRRWTAILFAWVVAVHGMFANTFSSDLINGYFKVDPAHFTVTNIFLTTVYFLVGVFQPLVMFPLSLASLFLGVYVVAVLFLMGMGMQALKRIGLFLLATALISASTQNLSLLQHQLPRLAELVALRADFNEKHRCTTTWAVNVDKVIFLHDGNVLAHISGTRNYEVLPCNPR